MLSDKAKRFIAIGICILMVVGCVVPIAFF